ncbi:hypothetical protein HC766_08645 [Candidatus Gracilibacteria bacterium]|nr:hypothetical protein [Candidatus Gracilibacteria bacterium]
MVSRKEEGRRKKEEGRRKSGELRVDRIQVDRFLRRQKAGFYNNTAAATLNLIKTRFI